MALRVIYIYEDVFQEDGDFDLDKFLSLTDKEKFEEAMTNKDMVVYKLDNFERAFNNQHVYGGYIKIVDV